MRGATVRGARTLSHVDKRGRTDQTRGRGGVPPQTNPDYVRVFLSDVDYPASKQLLIRHARSHGAPTDVIATLDRIQEREYKDPIDLGDAIDAVL